MESEPHYVATLELYVDQRPQTDRDPPAPGSTKGMGTKYMSSKPSENHPSLVKVEEDKRRNTK